MKRSYLFLLFALFTALSLMVADVVAAQGRDEDKNADESDGGSVAPAGGNYDAFGYSWHAGGSPECAPFMDLDISTTGTMVVSGDDEISAPITLGAGFEFYNLHYTQISMASNGYLTTNGSPSGGDISNDCPLPTIPSTGGGARIYPLHDDLISDGYYEFFADCPRPSDVLGSEPCSIFQWSDVEHFPASSPFDMWTILYHTSDEIVTQVGPGNPETGSGSTTGIQNLDATIGLTYGCNVADSIPDNSAVCFHRNEPTDVAISGVDAASGSSRNLFGLLLLSLVTLAAAIQLNQRRELA